MNGILIVLLIIIALISYFAFSSKYGKTREKYSQGIDFYFTLIATAFGVVLALYFTNQMEINKDKQFAIELLEVAKTNVRQNIAQNNANLHTYKRVKLDSLNVAANPLLYPSFAEKTFY